MQACLAPDQPNELSIKNWLCVCVCAVFRWENPISQTDSGRPSAVRQVYKRCVCMSHQNAMGNFHFYGPYIDVLFCTFLFLFFNRNFISRFFDYFLAKSFDALHVIFYMSVVKRIHTLTLTAADVIQFRWVETRRHRMLKCHRWISKRTCALKSQQKCDSNQTKPKFVDWMLLPKLFIEPFLGLIDEIFRSFNQFLIWLNAHCTTLWFINNNYSIAGNCHYYRDFGWEMHYTIIRTRIEWNETLVIQSISIQVYLNAVPVFIMRNTLRKVLSANCLSWW